MMGSINIKEVVEKAIASGNGVLYLRPSWIARDSLPPGKRLGLREQDYYLGERGAIIARCLGSETTADTPKGPPDEGLSYLDIEGYDVLLKDAVAVCGETIMGKEYASTHQSLGRLAKVFDFGCRLYYHLHQMEKDAAKVGKIPKEEAYYFLEGAELGPHPETFFGVHPYIVEQGLQEQILLPYLEKWDSDLILKHSRAYLNVPGEGFHLPAGGLHAPGTALTLELQEPSDVFAVLQAKVNGNLLSKELLFKDVSSEDRERYGEKAVLNQVDWELNGDPYFYEHRHIKPLLIESSVQDGGYEEWIIYNSTKFSAKKLTVKPASHYHSFDQGVYNVFVWQGEGLLDSKQIEGKRLGLDELLVTHDRAVKGFTIKNTGTADLILFKIFGPDIDNPPFKIA
jgi:hypothetical protein